jgi:hypothetical protein
MKIFVSSTSRDLPEERTAVIAELGRGDEVAAMEKFFASDHRPRDECLARLRKCDAVVLILGRYYGTIDDESGLSITELEYRTAKDLHIPVFAFLKKDEDGGWVTAETDPDRLAKHQAFKRLIDNGETRKDFRTVSELAREVSHTIQDFERRHGLIGARVSTFQTPAQFFRPFEDTSAIFSHAHPLVGRSNHVERLTAFPKSDRRVAVLIGRGGMGKTKLLREALGRVQSSDDAPTIRLLREGVVFNRDAARELPAGPLLVVADNAHRVDGLTELIAVAQKYPDRIRLILSTRPYGVPVLRRRLVEAGFGGDAAEELPEIGDLTRDEVATLAREVLGPVFAHHANRLVAVSRDSPLVTVVGARLLAEQRIDPALLVNSDVFEREVFSRFQDVLVEALPAYVGVERARDVLRVVAALGPFRPDSEALVERAADFLEIRPDQFQDTLSALQGTGVLLRRGFSLRVTPDVLSEHVLEQACITPDGKSTRYADRIFVRFHDVSLGHLLRNLAELDWRVGHDRGDVDLLGRIWGEIEQLYAHLQGYSRQLLVEAVAQIAYFQPQRALGFVRVALEQLEPKDSATGHSIYLSPREGVLRALPRMLDDIAHYPDTIRECVNVIWELRAEAFDRPRFNADHPVRVLQRIAKVEPGKPTWVYDALLDRLDAWLDRDDAFAHGWSPLDVLDAVLKREGTVHSASGAMFMWREFTVTVGTFGPVRERAIGILAKLGRRDDPPVQRRVLESLLAAFWRPVELDPGSGVGDAELVARREENETIARIVESLIERAQSDLLCGLVAHELSQVLSPVDPTLHDDATGRLLAQVSHDYPTRLISYLWRSTAQRPLWLGDRYLLREEMEQEVRTIAREFIGHHLMPGAAKAELERLLGNISSYGVAAKPSHFLSALAAEDAGGAAHLADIILGDPGSPLSSVLAWLLLPIRERDYDEFFRLVSAAAASDYLPQVEVAALTLSRVDGLRAPEQNLIGQLATRHEPEVMLHVVTALSMFPADAREEAIRIACTVDIGTDSYLADQLFEVFVGGDDVIVVDVPSDVLATLRDKLVSVEEISESSNRVRAFIDWLAVRDPLALADLFLARVRLYVARTPDLASGYRPVPYAQFWHFPTEVAEPGARCSALRRVRDAVLDPELTDPYWLRQLFASMSGGFDDVSLGVLAEWVESRDEDRITAVARLLEAADPSFVFDHEAFTVHLLTTAERTGTSTLRAVQKSLEHSALSGGGLGKPGEPMPHYLELQARATQEMAQHGEGSAARALYMRLANHAAALIEDDRLHWEETEQN